MRLSGLAILFAGIVYAGCGGGGHGSSGAPLSSGGTPTNPPPVISSLTVSKSTVSLNEAFSATVVATDAVSLVIEWTQLSGPSVTFVSGQNSPTVNMTSPSAGGAGTIVLKVKVTRSQGPGQTEQTINVAFNPPAAANQHNLQLQVIDDPDPTAGDQISAILTKIGGGTPAYGVSISYLVTLKTGQTKTLTANVASPLFRNDITFGAKPAGAGTGDIQVSDLQSVVATVTGGMSRTVNLSFTVGGTGTVNEQAP